jgi:hypothetical protein
LGLLTGCPAAEQPGSTDPGTGGSKATGGSTGSGGAKSTGGSTGSGGTVSGSGGSAAGSGGSSDPGTGGAASGTGGASADASSDTPSPGTGGSTGTGGSPADASGGDTPSSDDEFGNVSLPGKPWIRLCPKEANQAQCCDMLCRCLNKNCKDSPADQANIAKCNNLCMGYSNMAMRCHVYHCFESLNPNVTKDHASHCGHASNRVGGGGCPAPVYQ